MSKTLENADGNWLDRLLNCWPFCLDMNSIRSVGMAWGFKQNGKWCFTPVVVPNDSLFYNGILFLRLSLPFGLFFHVRWAADWRRSFLQTGIGWKLNGRLAVLLRIQSDTSAAAGTSGPNYGQAQGFDFGPH